MYLEDTTGNLEKNVPPYTVLPGMHNTVLLHAIDWNNSAWGGINNKNFHFNHSMYIVRLMNVDYPNSRGGGGGGGGLFISRTFEGETYLRGGLMMVSILHEEL